MSVKTNSNARSSSRFFVGLDLGQASDYTALAVLERPHVGPETPRELRRPAYAVRHLQRFTLGTPYTTIVQAVLSIIQTPTLRGCVFSVDQTGVGRAVVDQFTETMKHRVNCTFVPITITAGSQVHSSNGQGLLVPKKELVGVLQILLQNRRLQIARSLADADTLVRELQNFRVKITAARHETFEAWREGAHDDLVLAVALAAWCGEKTLPSMETQRSTR